MKKMFVMSFCILSLSICGFAFAFDDEDTHPRITKMAITNSKIDAILRSNLGLQDGFSKIVKNNSTGEAYSIFDWLWRGSRAEDHPMCRASHHFHNPLLPWLQSQMSDTPWMNYACDVPRYSNITWATGYTSPPPFGAKTNVAVSPFYSRVSWDSARDYYYKALTSSANSDRENYFAKTFEAVGHVLHLLEDMAVPAHTRNDFQSHLFPTSYSLLDSFFDRASAFEQYVKSNPNLIASALPVSPVFADTRLTDFWDTDQYNGSNPSTFTNIGLAEFSNANYFSYFTIPNNGTTPEHTFPYPHLGGANTSGPNYQVCSYQFLNVVSVNYVSRTNSGPCPPTAAAADHFAVVSLMNMPGISSDINSISHVWLNDEVHEQYAKDLLPRAVGYSAGLLNYFFRGDLEVIRAVNGIKVKNQGAETMSSYVDPLTGNTIGDIQVYYDTTANVRRLVKSCSLTAPDCWQTPPNQLTPGAATDLIPFPLPTDNIKPNQYIVVFRGKLGNEEGAVIGRVDNSWSEEWDNDLKGNHPWLYTDVDFVRSMAGVFYSNLNTVTDGRLIKENVRQQGEKYAIMNSTLTQTSYLNPLGSDKPYCIDESYAMCLDYDFGKEFPVPITKNTWVRVKIDEMSVNVDIPYQNCNSAKYGPGGYQGITLGFDNGNGFTFTVPGQVPIAEDLTSYIEPGVEKAFNIFDAFKKAGVVFKEPVNLTGIEIQQMLWFLCEPSTEEHRQRMVVDYIRLEER